MSKQTIARLARLAAAIVATSACAALPASAASARSSILIRPCYQTGPQIWETVETVGDINLYFVQGSCFTAGAPVYLQYVGTFSDGAPFWSVKEYTTADSNGDILVKLLAPGGRIAGSDHIRAFNDDNAEEPSNAISVPLPLGTTV